MVATIAIIIVAVFFSAFFSGMEIAFLSSNKLKLEIEKKQSSLFSRIADIFVRNPSQYITTILVGNNIALVIYSLQMTVLLGILFSQYNLGNSIVAQTIISTVVIIFSAEFLPKAVFKANPNFYFRTFALPVYFFYILFYPIVMFSSLLSKLILRLFGLKLKNAGYTATFDKIDLAHLLEEATDNDEQHNNEHEIKLFQNALEFPDLKVRDCMIPRVDIDAVDINSPLDELKKIFVDTRFSRIPVYDGSIDNVVGYVNSKSLFRHPQRIRDVMRTILYVPESMEIQKLLASFIKRNSSIAVVIDEFGGTAGMITIEDILEEIFGEIEDEHDSQDMVEKVLGDNQFVFSCRLEVEYLNEKYGLDIPESDDYDTLAGYILFNHNGLPKQGETLEIGGNTIKVLRMSASKIDLVRLVIGGNASDR